MSLFLGLDCSTQSLSAVLIDYGEKKVVFEHQLIFQKEFPHYGTKSGILRQGSVVHSPPLMWVEALEKFFSQLCHQVDTNRILAISGSAQQHGSVYLNASFSQALKKSGPLKERLMHVFSRDMAPIWMDASTEKECEEIRSALGGMRAVIEATGSNTFERFTAAQIRKFYKTERENYNKTHSIALVSSFFASLLSGEIAPIDYGDGSGMNLMDIRKKEWHAQALEATAPGLREKLPPLAPSSRAIKPIHPYFVEKYGINPKALCIAWTGDNPSSMIGLGMIEPGMAAVSLGTSFTHFGCIHDVHTDPQGEGHLFVSPTGDYMTLNCFLNGALAIQRMRESYGYDWPAFIRALQETPPGNNGALLLPYFETEIVPRVVNPSLHRFQLSPDDGPANCRALIEAQMMAIRIHSEWMQLHSKKLLVTGGVAHNAPILQILSDVMDLPIYNIDVSKSTALGAALRAAFAYYGNKSWKEILGGFTHSALVATPNPASVKTYRSLIKEYRAREKAFLNTFT
ncbi:MAG TPA: FGGY family carbohydrate kinase [Rhabdochlamydiaceae bacterium]|jgi:xylulokinase